MQIRAPLAAIAVAVLPSLATAQPIDGLYVGAGAGANFMPAERAETNYDGHSLSYSGNPSVPSRLVPYNYGFRGSTGFAVGGAGVASVGYGTGRS